jgi:DNA-binding NtrC family response regulator
MHPQIVLITEDFQAAGIIQSSLSDWGHELLKVDWVRNLSPSLEWLKNISVAAIILDLFLPDSWGIERFEKVSVSAPGIPILILTNPGDEEAAKEAVHRGAQDFITRDLLNNYSVPRAVRTAFALNVATDALVGDKEKGPLGGRVGRRVRVRTGRKLAVLLRPTSRCREPAVDQVDLPCRDRSLSAYKRSNDTVCRVSPCGKE